MAYLEEASSGTATWVTCRAGAFATAKLPHRERIGSDPEAIEKME